MISDPISRNILEILMAEFRKDPQHRVKTSFLFGSVAFDDEKRFWYALDFLLHEGYIECSRMPPGHIPFLCDAVITEKGIDFISSGIMKEKK